MKWEFPEKLQYAYDALEPHIDAKTMEIHHQKHHRAYFDNAIKALGGMPSSTVEETLLSHLESAVQNNAGGFYNHALFWQMLTPRSSKAPIGALKNAIDAKWNSFAEFRDAFEKAGLTRFGSGWAWLAKNKSNGEIEIFSEP